LHSREVFRKAKGLDVNHTSVEQHVAPKIIRKQYSTAPSSIVISIVLARWPLGLGRCGAACCFVASSYIEIDGAPQTPKPLPRRLLPPTYPCRLNCPPRPTAHHRNPHLTPRIISASHPDASVILSRFPSSVTTYFSSSSSSPHMAAHATRCRRRGSRESAGARAAGAEAAWGAAAPRLR
jgi:hypothetical protein